MMTPHFHYNHLIDTTVASGPDYVDTTSLKNMYHRNYDKTMEFLQKVKPDLHVVQDTDTTGDTTTTTGAASSSKKKGVRTTTISSDYDMEIVVKHVKRG